MKRIIAVDFDGTLVKHKFPEIGAPVDGAFGVLRELQAAGVHLILSTMRSGETLEQAIRFCEAQGVRFWGHNENPEQRTWTASPKVYAQMYIGDDALGCPLVRPGMRERPWCNWAVIREQLVEQGWLPRAA